MDCTILLEMLIWVDFELSLLSSECHYGSTHGLSPELPDNQTWLHLSGGRGFDPDIFQQEVVIRVMHNGTIEDHHNTHDTHDTKTVYTQSRNDTRMVKPSWESGNSDDLADRLAQVQTRLEFGRLLVFAKAILPRFVKGSCEMSWTAAAKEIDMLLLSSLISYLPAFDAFMRGLTLPSLGYFIFAKSTFAVPGGLFADMQFEYQQNATCQWPKSSLENSSKNQPPGTRTLWTFAGVHQARGFESFWFMQFWWVAKPVIFRRTSQDAVEEVGCEILFVQRSPWWEVDVETMIIIGIRSSLW